MSNKLLGGIFVLAVLASAIPKFMGHNGVAPREDKAVEIPAAKLGASPSAPRQIDDNVVAFRTTDKSMNDAKDHGRKTLPRFLKMLANGDAGTYSVKFPLTQNGATEHIWLQIDDYQNDTFAGRLADVPVNGTKYKMGDVMTVAKADVEDWMIRDGDAIWGAYTARVAVASLPEDQAKAMQAMFRD
jgi:uncharacterized protein YegJ (DUF2314 family)